GDEYISGSIARYSETLIHLRRAEQRGPQSGTGRVVLADEHVCRTHPRDSMEVAPHVAGDINIARRIGGDRTAFSVRAGPSLLCPWPVAGRAEFHHNAVPIPAALVSIESGAGVSRHVDVPGRIRRDPEGEIALSGSPLGQPQPVSRRVILADEHVVASG